MALLHLLGFENNLFFLSLPYVPRFFGIDTQVKHLKIDIVLVAVIITEAESIFNLFRVQ